LNRILIVHAAMSEGLSIRVLAALVI